MIAYLNYYLLSYLCNTDSIALVYFLMLYPCMPHAHPPVYKLQKLQAAIELSILTVLTCLTYSSTSMYGNNTNLIQIDLINYDSLASGWDCGTEDSWLNRAPRADRDTKTLV